MTTGTDHFRSKEYKTMTSDKDECKSHMYYFELYEKYSLHQVTSNWMLSNNPTFMTENETKKCQIMQEKSMLELLVKNTNEMNRNVQRMRNLNI